MLRRPLRTLARSLSTIIHKSPHAAIEIPRKTVFELIGERIPQFAQRNALVCGLTDETVSYQDLYESAKGIAAGLASEGVKKGDVVLLHSLNCLEFPSVLLALYALGAVCSPVSTACTANEVAQQARLVEARFVITHRALEDVAIDAAQTVGIPKSRTYTVGTSKQPQKLKSINEVMHRDVESLEFEQMDPELPSLIPFSSGTTGLPKGVSLRSRNLVANTLHADHVEDGGDHILALLPWVHIYPVSSLHFALYQGATNVVLPHFEPESFLSALSRYRIVKPNITPPIAHFLAYHPLVDKFDLSATKFLVCGGSPLSAEVETRLSERLHVTVKQVYGMTEASPALNYTEDQFSRQGSVGRLVPNTELRVKCIETNKDLASNKMGELLYRGPQIFQGYHGNEEATKQALTPDGFLQTGDFGYIDDDGFVFVIDRLKELIKYQGYQVAPAELESILATNPQIAEACVVRGCDEFGEELPKAFIVRKSPGLTEDEVKDFVASKVEDFKQVRQVEFIDDMPKNATGKILRRELQKIENRRCILREQAVFA